MVPRIGLTGNIGSGKSTVAQLFQQQGITTIDADQISRQLTQSGTTEFQKIVAIFGDDVIDHNGEMNRRKLADIVFNDNQRREELESVLHPSIREMMFDLSQQSQSAYCILEIPLLMETGQHTEMDRVLLVTCSTEIKTQRLKQSRQMDTTTIKRILNSQMKDQQKIELADDVIANDTSMEDLKQNVLHLHEKYLTLFKN